MTFTKRSNREASRKGAWAGSLKLLLVHVELDLPAIVFNRDKGELAHHPARPHTTSHSHRLSYLCGRSVGEVFVFFLQPGCQVCPCKIEGIGLLASLSELLSLPAKRCCQLQVIS